jgi:methyl coenzyme M reductase subunit C-like uncharacterized protein (methanogenesis marker protein 7)
MKVLGRLALTALAVLAVGSFALAGEKGVTQGKVTAVSDKVVTVALEDGAELTFEVTQGARVYGTGAGRKSRMLKSSGRMTTMDDFVREGSYVTVHYREQDGTRYLTSLRVL